MLKKITISALVIALQLTNLCSANDIDLPNLGTPSDSVLSPVKEKEIRDSIIQQIYEYDLVMLDPIIADYIEKLGFGLAVYSENPKAPFDFFVVNQNIVNASAYPGGLIIMYSGLFLRTDTESELASVMAHEIAHATQRHMSRFYANVKKNTIPMILGMLGAAVAARYSDSRDAPIAMATAVTALNQQAMINYTRAHEYEADRVGIKNLEKAHYNPLGMANFFEKLMREKPSDERFQLPEYLRTHPLSINRVSEAKNRAHASAGKEYKESELYDFVKERLRVLTKDIGIDNASYYRKLFSEKKKSDITPSQYYGYALSLYYSHENSEALKIVEGIKSSYETQLMINLLKANIISELNRNQGKKIFQELYKTYPESPIVIEPYIQMLSRSKDFKDRKKARNLARKLVYIFPEKPNYYGLLAIANQNIGKSIEANEALASKEHKIHNNYRAVRILKNILKQELDYYQRARIEAKITKFENLITNEERQREIQQENKGRRRQ